MGIKSNYIPRKDMDLMAWSANFTAFVVKNASAWGIPPDETSGLQIADSTFAALLAQADGPNRSPIIVSKKNAARKTLEDEIRTLVGFRLKNPLITDAERIGLGLHSRDRTYSTIPAPHTRPELYVDVVDARRLKILFRDTGSKSRAKPYGIDGAVVAYEVLDAPPVDPRLLTRNVLATRSPYILKFTDQERGKTVYVAVCWQNKKGQRGPWSRIERAIVP